MADDDRAPDWLMSSLAAQDAYRGDDADFPPSPSYGFSGPYAREQRAAARGFPDEQASAIASGLGAKSLELLDLAATPGNLLWGDPRYQVTPEVPGQWSERDQYRQDQLNDELANRGAQTALHVTGYSAMGAPIREYGLGAGGGRMVQPAPRTLATASDQAPTAPRVATYRGYPKDTSTLGPADIEKWVDNPQRVLKPGIYKNPRLVAEEAAANVAPEHPALQQLFGVTRDDLYQIGQKGTRQGNIDPIASGALWVPSKSSGSASAEAVMNPKNAQRMIDSLSEAEKYPQLTRGMDAWYVMDPAYQRLVQLVGPDQAKVMYTNLNMRMTPFSQNSDVFKEINRGTAANMAINQGRFPEFAQYGGVPVKERGADFPADFADVIPHLRHSSHMTPMERYLQTGEHGYAENTVKIPLYTMSSGVPQTGFQTKLPVPDAHFARASGIGDVRLNQDPGKFMAGPEYRSFGPWYAKNVADPLGIQAVPAQARMWGVYAPQTGVKTPVGAPKLELLAQRIWERAQRLGMDPRELRDQVLMGKNYANWLLPTAGGAMTMGALADQGGYQQ